MEILAWARLTGADPTPFEVRAIKAVDYLFMAHQAKKSND